VRATTIPWILTFALVNGAFAPARAADLNFTANTPGEKRIVSCSDIDIRFWKDRLERDGIVTARRDRTVALRADPSTPLKVKAPARGGIRVQPSSDGTFAAFVCMAAGAGSDVAAQAILDRLEVHNDRGELSVTGPDTGDWAAYVVLSAPPGLAMELSAMNGELTLRDVDGRFTLRTTNGPISLAHVGGEVDAEAVNGPIAYRGHAGDVRLATQNGPVGVDLDAPSWSGKGMDASTQNGPIHFSAPSGLKCGVQVESSTGSPATWNGQSQPIGDGSGTRSYRFGEGPVLVRVSTQHGPLEIRAPRRAGRGTTI